jgi:nucleotide-binding universal stress UspA family protein
MFKRILVPLDNSEGSRRALDFAARWSQASGGKIRLVHYIDVQAFPNASGSGYGDPVIQSAERYADSFLAEQKFRLEESGVQVETELCLAIDKRLGQCISEAARAWEADLIVLGSHGRKGIGRVLLGSGAEQIIREAPVPVLVIPAGN